MLYRDFLYFKFSELFTGTIFRIKNEFGLNMPLYNWDDPVFSTFMVDILSKLCPRKELAETVIFNTLEEVNEIFFIEEGSVNIGFEINRGAKFVVRLCAGGVIGGFNCTFNRKTIFIYKVYNDFEGHTLKKH